MSKKWLYSVAAGALLMAGEALGITVHDVLSNGFWSTQERATEMSLNAATTDNYKEKYKKEQSEQTPDGYETKSFVYTKKAKTTNDVAWTQNKFHAQVTGNELEANYNTQTIKVKNNDRKEVDLSEDLNSINYMETCPTNILEASANLYSFKPTKKGARPVEPFFPDTEWFKQLTSVEYPGVCGRALAKDTTNIISDTEAKIRGVMMRSSLLHFVKIGFPNIEFGKDPENSSYWGHVLYPYEKTITVSNNHVIVEQTIGEDTTFTHTTTGEYQTKYIASFNKKGAWKKSTETVTKWRSSQANDWYTNYYRIQQQNTTE